MQGETKLEGSATCPGFDRHPFLATAACKGYARQAWALYAGRIHCMAARHLTGLARLLALCPDADLRLFLLENYLEEGGIAIRDGRLGRRPGAAHTELALRFTRACGVADASLDAPRFQTPSAWLDEQMRAGQWAACLGYVSVGIELNVPKVFGPLAAILQSVYGFKPDETLFFSLHVEADDAHGAQGLRLLTQAVAKGLANDEDVCRGARKGANAWWAFHLHCHREMKRI